MAALPPLTRSRIPPAMQAIKVLRREVEILNGPEALVELRDIITLSISVELVGDKKTLEAWGLPK